jgi:hypothetical protein
MKKMLLIFGMLTCSLLINAQSKKISEMTVATSVTGAELVPIVQSGVNKSASINLLNYGEKGIYNVLNYGAKGDGMTDDRSSIQSAVDAATINGGIVYLPRGTYITKSEIILKSNVVFKGAGKGFTILKAGTGWTNSNGGMITFHLDSKNIRIQDLTIDGNKTILPSQQHCGIYSYNRTEAVHSYPNDVYLNNIEVKGTSDHAIAFPTGTNIQIVDSWIHNTGDQGNAAGIYFGGDHLKVSNCIVDSVYQHGIYLSYGHDDLIENSFFRHNGIGSAMGCGLSLRADSNLVVVGNIITNNGDNGIAVIKSDPDFVTNVLIADNFIKDNASSQSPYTQVIITHAKNIKFTNNTVKLLTIGTTISCISLYSVNSNVNITGNDIVGPLGVTINSTMYADVFNINVLGNIFYNVDHNNEDIVVLRGIDLYYSTATSSHTVVANNVFENVTTMIRTTSDWDASGTVNQNNISW